MPWTREKIDWQLSALDRSIVMMRAQARCRNDILAAFLHRAESIREEAGEDSRYVSARLRSIRFANGLDTGAQSLDPRPALERRERHRLITLIRRACTWQNTRRGVPCRTG
jgi:hypothetical protein